MVHDLRAAVRVAILCASFLLATAGSGLACSFDLTGPKADRVFFMLGMLFEYHGQRPVAGSTQVELIYCNQKDQLPLFRRVLGDVAKEQGLPADLREETKQDCLTLLHSTSLAPRFSACYPHRSGALSLSLFARPGASVAPGATRISAADLDRRRALAYLAGVWARYRSGRSIVLTAGAAKAALVSALLKALGCANVRVETTVDYIPGASTVHFEPTAEVSEWLRKAW